MTETKSSFLVLPVLELQSSESERRAERMTENSMYFGKRKERTCIVAISFYVASRQRMIKKREAEDIELYIDTQGLQVKPSFFSSHKLEFRHFWRGNN